VDGFAKPVPELPGSAHLVRLILRSSLKLSATHFEAAKTLQPTNLTKHAVLII
jgi:hypothetical protein